MSSFRFLKEKLRFMGFAQYPRADPRVTKKFKITQAAPGAQKFSNEKFRTHAKNFRSTQNSFSPTQDAKFSNRAQEFTRRRAPRSARSQYARAAGTHTRRNGHIEIANAVRIGQRRASPRTRARARAAAGPQPSQKSNFRARGEKIFQIIF